MLGLGEALESPPQTRQRLTAGAFGTKTRERSRHLPGGEQWAADRDHDHQRDRRSGRGRKYGGDANTGADQHGHEGCDQHQTRLTARIGAPRKECGLLNWRRVIAHVGARVYAPHPPTTANRAVRHIGGVTPLGTPSPRCALTGSEVRLDRLGAGEIAPSRQAPVALSALADAPAVCDQSVDREDVQREDRQRPERVRRHHH